MKKSLLFMAMLGLSSLAGAQTTIYSESFDDITGGLGVLDYDGDGHGWGIYTGDETTDGWGFVGGFAGSRSWGGVEVGPLEPDNFIITPDIEVPANGICTLNFLYGAIDSQYFEEQFSVYVFDPETITSIADLIALTPAYSEIIAEGQVAFSQEVDLSDFAGTTVNIAFRHHDSYNQNIFIIDEITVTQSLSTEGFAAASLTVSPNPVSSVLSIDNTTNVALTGASIVDINGRTVRSINLNAASAQINVADLAAGVYMINIASERGSVVKKFVKS